MHWYQKITFSSYPLRKFKAWTSHSEAGRIFWAAVAVSAGTGLVYLIHAAKDIYAAFLLGTSDAIEAFIMAYAVPSFIVNVAAGSLASAFVPVYLRVKINESFEAASSLFLYMMVVVSLFLFLIVSLLWVNGDFIINALASSFNSSKKNLTIGLFHLMLPIILLQGVVSLCASVLNATNRFILAAFAPVLSPIISIILLYFMFERLGVYALAWGTLAGTSFQLLLLFSRSYQKRVFTFTAIRSHPAFRSIWQQYVPMLAGAMLMSGTTMVDQIMTASLLPARSLAAITYGDRIVSAILALAGTSLGTVTLPAFSRLVVQMEWKRLWHTVYFYRKLIWLCSIPALFLLIFFSKFIVQIVWERGAFLPDDTKMVSKIQAIYALRIPFFLIGIIHARVLSSIGRNQILFWIAGVNFALNIPLNYVLAKILDARGIALATVIVYAISYVISYLYLKKHESIQHQK